MIPSRTSPGLPPSRGPACGADRPGGRRPWAGDGRLPAVAFVATECPLAELYAGRLAELAAGFGPKGVAFVAVASNRQETRRDAGPVCGDARITFPIHGIAPASSRPGPGRPPLSWSCRRLARHPLPGEDHQYRAVTAPGRNPPARPPASKPARGPTIDQPRPRRSAADHRPETGTDPGSTRQSSGHPPITMQRMFTDLAVLRLAIASAHRPVRLTTYRQGRAGPKRSPRRSRSDDPWHADPAYGMFANVSIFPMTRSTSLRPGGAEAVSGRVD